MVDDGLPVKVNVRNIAFTWYPVKLTVTSTGRLFGVPDVPVNRTDTAILLVESPGAIGVGEPDGVVVPYTAMFFTSSEKDVGTV